MGEQGAVADRIHFIREVLLQGDSFGQVLKPLAQGPVSLIAFRHADAGTEIQSAASLG